MYNPGLLACLLARLRFIYFFNQIDDYIVNYRSMGGCLMSVGH